MDSDTSRYSHKAEDVVALDWVTTFGQLILDIINLLVYNQRIGRTGRRQAIVEFTLLLTLIGLGSCGSALIIGTAQELDQAEEAWDACVDAITSDE